MPCPSHAPVSVDWITAPAGMGAPNHGKHQTGGHHSSRVFGAITTIGTSSSQLEIKAPALTQMFNACSRNSATPITFGECASFHASARVALIADIAVTLLLAGVMVWVARAYVMKPYTVPTGSMEPTLMIGDYVIADRVSLDFGDPSRFDIVVFHPPHCKNGLNDSQGACTTSNRKLRDGAASTTFIKRVIGLPGTRSGRRRAGT